MPNATCCNPRSFAGDTYFLAGNSTFSVLEYECNRKMQKLYKWCCTIGGQVNAKR